MKKTPSNSSPLHRRRLLQLGLGATAGILTTDIGCNNAAGETAHAADPSSTCEVTPGKRIQKFKPIVDDE